MLFQPRREIWLLVLLKMNTAVHLLHGLLEASAGRRNFMVAEKLLHFITHICAAEVRSGIHDGGPTACGELAGHF